MALYEEENPEMTPLPAEIPDWATIIDSWSKGTTQIARKDPADYEPFPREKENWNVPAPPVDTRSTTKRIMDGIMGGFKTLNKGYYEGKVPEELK